MADFLQRLKQRKLVQWAIAYIAFAFALIQVLDVVAGSYHWPDHVMHVGFGVLVLGFIVTLVLAWYHGERGAQRVSGPELLLIALALTVGGGLLWHFGRNETPNAEAKVSVHGPGSAGQYSDAPAGAPLAASTSTPSQASAPAYAAVPVPAASIPQKSVAVLPFVNDSGDKNQQYFSDGLSEDLITTLSQFAGLKVISRDSAFQFRHSTDSSRVIGDKLGVAHLLEGSVQRAQDEVRITATLVNATDGTVVWSQRYDKPYKDLFALQDAITQAVADALKAKLLTTPGAVAQSDRPPSGNLAAWNAYSRGMTYLQAGSEQSMHDAASAFDEAIKLDPRYVAAYTMLSTTWTVMAAQYMGGAQAAQAYAEARTAVNAALKLDPDSSSAHQANAELLLLAEMDWRGAEAEAQRALQLAPSDDRAKWMLGTVLATQGQVRRALTLQRQVVDGDPLNGGRFSELDIQLAALGRLDEAQQSIHTALTLWPGAAGFHLQLAYVEVLRGDAVAALVAAQQEPDGPSREIAMALARQIGPDRAAADAALKKLIADQSDSSAFQIAEVYALRRDPDAMFEWLDRAWANRDAGVGYLLMNPFILRYQDDPRFAAFCKKVGLPTTTDAKALP